MRPGARDHIGDRYAAATHGCAKRRAAGNLHAIPNLRATHTNAHAIPHAYARPGGWPRGATRCHQPGN